MSGTTAERAEAIFIAVLTDELAIERTPAIDMMCRLILYRLVQRGFVLVPLPDDLTATIASGITSTPEEPIDAEQL